MDRRTCPTYTATIYVGLEHKATMQLTPLSHLHDLVEQYVDTVKLCVTFTPTKFIYTNNSEHGVIIGLINYPRFPKSREEIREIALNLAFLCKEKAQQERVSVVFPDETITIGDF